MLGLITDRSQRNVDYRNSLSSKGWSGMTSNEKAEWLGDPWAVTGANLFPCGPNYSGSVELKYKSEEIVATAKVSGIYLFGVSILGESSKFENGIFTLSVDLMESSSVGTPQLAVYWHDDNGYDYAGASLLTPGSVTLNTTEWPNTNNRENLAVYVYVTTADSVEVGTSARFRHVMLEKGSTKHDYVPYTEILPTLATKGAYNYSDLNRVERAVAEISDLAGLGLVTKTDWGMWDIPKESDMVRYLGNIQTLRQILPNDSTAPIAPTTMNNFTYNEANNVEQIILAAYETLVGQGGS